MASIKKVSPNLLTLTTTIVSPGWNYRAVITCMVNLATSNSYPTRIHHQMIHIIKVQRFSTLFSVINVFKMGQIKIQILRWASPNNYSFTKRILLEEGIGFFKEINLVCAVSIHRRTLITIAVIQKISPKRSNNSWQDLIKGHLICRKYILRETILLIMNNLYNRMIMSWCSDLCRTILKHITSYHLMLH